MRLPIQIRWKILLAMLLIGIVPLVISAWRDVKILSQLGTMLAEQSGDALGQQTRASMEQMADAYTARVDRERETIELIVRLQGDHAQRLLRDNVLSKGPIFWAESFDAREPELQLGEVPEKYTRRDDAGNLVPQPVSYRHQSFFHASSIERSSELSDTARLLGSMETFYRHVHKEHGDIIYRQYVVTRHGLIASYPGHGGYPDDFRPRERAWYAEQKTAPGLRWSRSHTDVTSNYALVNITTPLLDHNGEFMGLAGVDVRLTSFLSGLEMPSRYASNSEVLLTFLNESQAGNPAEIVVVAKNTAASRGNHWRELPTEAPLEVSEERDLATMIANMRAGQGGYVRTRVNGKDVFCVYRPFGDRRSSLLFIVPASTVVNPAIKAAEYALASTKRQVDEIIPIAIAIVFAIALFALFSSKSITDPINRLAAAASRIGQGDFDVRVDIRTGDELERLGAVFDTMVPQLEEHTRVREALNIASEVQQHLLPDRNLELPGIDIAGFSHYCDQTGGDYYDYFEIDNEKPSSVAVALGDVSGHGLASALLMATVRALLRGFVTNNQEPAKTLDHINQKLVGDAHAGRFMTLFFMVVDAESRNIRWASAGHDPAVCYLPRDDRFTILEGQDIPLGIDRGWRYTVSGSWVVEGNAVVFLGTDGIWETRNETGEFFGKDRLQSVIREHCDKPAEAICGEIDHALNKFRGSAPQLDDVTAVVFRFQGPRS